MASTYTHAVTFSHQLSGRLAGLTHTDTVKFPTFVSAIRYAREMRAKPNVLCVEVRKLAAR